MYIAEGTYRIEVDREVLLWEKSMFSEGAAIRRVANIIKFMFQFRLLPCNYLRCQEMLLFLRRTAFAFPGAAAESCGSKLLFRPYCWEGGWFGVGGGVLGKVESAAATVERLFPVETSCFLLMLL